MMDKKVKKLLIIRFSSIGDIVWTTPVIRCVKQQIKDVELHFCTKIQYKSMVEANPYIDKLHYLEDPIGDLIVELKKENNVKSLPLDFSLNKIFFPFLKTEIMLPYTISHSGNSKNTSDRVLLFTKQSPEFKNCKYFPLAFEIPLFKAL